jgi:hypothetical protein
MMVWLGAVLFVVVSGFFFLGWVCHRDLCTFVCMWAANSEDALEKKT